MRVSRLPGVLIFAAIAAAAPEQGWWMTEPLRWLQLNLRQTDAAADPRRIVDSVEQFHANVLHFGMGGIVAYYPTDAPFHYRSPDLPAGRDLFGDVLALSHKRGIRVVGRFDFSKTRNAVFDAHPEWFFRKADGQPVVYNGLYSTCINGGYYREAAVRILTEALERYEVDGLFFNMFGNQSTDYSGKYVGNCHCDNCKRRFHQMFGKEIPDAADEDYRAFMYRCSREVAEEFGRLIHAKRPRAGYFNYLQEYTDGIMNESNTADRRPLPFWPYMSSDNVNRARNSEPGKMSVNLCMQFVEYPWRFATVAPPEIRLRLWENIANGGALAFSVNGTLDQQDRQAVEAARPVFAWAAENAAIIGGQESAARVLLLGNPAGGRIETDTQAYRGMFRFLTEEHIPFAVADNVRAIEARKFDLVVATDWAPKELAQYVAGGGRVLVASARRPELPVAAVAKTWRGVQGYVRVRDHGAFPSLAHTDVAMLEGDYAETQSTGAQPALTFVPPSMFGPPEFVHIDQTDTTKPGVVVAAGGRVVWFPWNVAGLYYRRSLPAHAGLLRDALNRLLPDRQLRTEAHPLIEMTLMRHGPRTLLHIVNLSGHSDTAYFEPMPARDVHMDVEGAFRKAWAVRGGSVLPATAAGGRTRFVVPVVKDYELVVLE